MPKIRTVSEVAVVIACVAVVADVVWSRLDRLRAAKHLPSSATQSQRASEYSAGDAAPSLGVDYAAARRTIVLVLRANCKFCTDSMPFYRRLKSEASTKHVKLVVVTSDPIDSFRRYLTSQGIEVDSIISVNPTAVRVRGTPTLLLVDNRGKVAGVWTGRLPPPEEDKLIGTLEDSH